MTQGMSFYMNNVVGEAVSLGLSVTLSQGRMVSNYDPVSSVSSDSDMSAWHNVVEFGNKLIVSSYESNGLSSLYFNTYDTQGATTYATKYIIGTKLLSGGFVNTGSTLEFIYARSLVGNSGFNVTGSTIYSISTSDGINWGGTQIIYGGSFVSSIRPVGATRLYMVEDISETGSQREGYLYSLIKEGTTWRKSLAYEGGFVHAANTSEPSQNFMNAFPSRNNSGLDDVILYADMGVSMSGGNPYNISLISTNGKCSFQTEVLYKTDVVPNQSSSGTEYFGAVRINMFLTTFGTSDIYRSVCFETSINQFVDGVASVRKLNTGNFASFSQRDGEWSSFFPIDNVCSSCCAGVSQGKILYSSPGSPRTRVLSVAGSTAYDISQLVEKYSNSNNQYINLEIGNVK